MMLDVYVGNLDSFDWDGGDNNGNAPKRRSPFFPFGRKAFDELRDRIDSGAYVGKQTDWGCWCARVSKQQIRDFIHCLYDGNADLDNPSGRHLKERYLELMAFVDALDPASEYALAAVEGW